jgi:hypothetical protein
MLIGSFAVTELNYTEVGSDEDFQLYKPADLSTERWNVKMFNFGTIQKLLGVYLLNALHYKNQKLDLFVELTEGF